MLYAIHGEDVLNSLEKRMMARPAHLERLQTLQNEGRLILAGPYPSIDSADPGSAERGGVLGAGGNRCGSRHTHDVTGHQGVGPVVRGDKERQRALV